MSGEKLAKRGLWGRREYRLHALHATGVGPDRSELMNGRYVQYGCGLSAPTGWENFDASPTLRFERIPLIGRLYTKNESRFPVHVRYGDIVKGLPVEHDSCSGIYCSHVLEHLALEDADQALRNTLCYLKPGGGRFRLVVPDLRRLANEYLASDSTAAAYQFMEATCLGRKHLPRGVAGIAKDLLGNSLHLWMWDEKSLGERLRQHGFTSVRRCSVGDAADPKFGEVEDKRRFAGCLAMECRK